MLLVRKKNQGTSTGTLTRRAEHQIVFAVDAQAKPLRMILSANQTADINCAAYLIEKIPLSALIADKGYDSNTLVRLKLMAHRLLFHFALTGCSTFL